MNPYLEGDGLIIVYGVGKRGAISEPAALRRGKLLGIIINIARDFGALITSFRASFRPGGPLM